MPLIWVTLHVIEIFLARHWLAGITNASLTALLGLALLRWAQTWRILRLSSLHLLRLRRFVLLFSLGKGAFYLLLGISFSFNSHLPLISGLQFPDPDDLFGLVPLSVISLWHPTSITKLVSSLLVGAASILLIFRLIQLLRSKQSLHQVLGMRLVLGMRTQSGEARIAEEARIQEIMTRAVTVMGLSGRTNIPRLVLVELPHPTPILVGGRQPYLLLSPSLAQRLADLELELAFRHELAHFQRHDHWWRWFFSWIEDVGRLNFFSGRLASQALDIEEELCDRLAVRNPSEALALAKAIEKTARFYQGYNDAKDRTDFNDHKESQNHKEPKDASLAENKASLAEKEASLAENIQSSTTSPFLSLEGSKLPTTVLPALLGRHTRKWSRPSSLTWRLQHLLPLACELSETQKLFVAQKLPSQQDRKSRRDHKLSFATQDWKEGLFFTLRVTMQSAAYLCLGVLLFAILYAKFYLALTLFDTPTSFHQFHW